MYCMNVLYMYVEQFKVLNPTFCLKILSSPQNECYRNSQTGSNSYKTTIPILVPLTATIQHSYCKVKPKIHGLSKKDVDTVIIIVPVVVIVLRKTLNGTFYKI